MRTLNTKDPKAGQKGTHSDNRLSLIQDILAKLISFDTTSRLSNLAIIQWIEAQLAPLGAELIRIPNSTGDKANLWARLGPDVPGGIVLSGHTDVVPVDGQDWVTDPFMLTESDGLLYGRGTCDMKSFIALCLAFAPEIAKIDLKRPVHFAFSHDEEVGCQGAPAMIDEIVRRGAAPSAVWVGEPSEWQVISRHKGIVLTEVEVTGREAHSSLPDEGVSAIGEAVGLMAKVIEIAEGLKREAQPDSDFATPYPTLTIGEVGGGTASNILARQCRFLFDMRCPPGFDVDAVLAPFLAEAERVDASIKARAPEGGVSVTRLTHVPPLDADPGSAAETLLRALTGDNSMRAVGYTTEAGQFRAAGFPSVICGPGSIEQAHKPNEFLAVSELERGVAVFEGLVARLRSA